MAFSARVALVAPFLRARQVAYLVSRKHIRWRKVDRLRLRYVLEIKRRVVLIAENYGGLSSLPQSSLISFFLGEAVQTSARWRMAATDLSEPSYNNPQDKPSNVPSDIPAPTPVLRARNHNTHHNSHNNSSSSSTTTRGSLKTSGSSGTSVTALSDFDSIPDLALSGSECNESSEAMSRAMGGVTGATGEGGGGTGLRRRNNHNNALNNLHNVSRGSAKNGSPAQHRSTHTHSFKSRASSLEGTQGDYRDYRDQTASDSGMGSAESKSEDPTSSNPDRDDIGDVLAKELGYSILGPRDMASLLQSGLACAWQGRVVQLNQQILLSHLFRQPRLFVLGVLYELSQGSPRVLLPALLSLLSVGQACVLAPVDVARLLEASAGVPIPRQRHYLAGGRRAGQSYILAVAEAADELVRRAEPYLALTLHLQRAYQHSDPSSSLSDPSPSVGPSTSLFKDTKQETTTRPGERVGGEQDRFVPAVDPEEPKQDKETKTESV